MPTLATGASATVNLANGDVCNVSINSGFANVTVTPVNGSIRTWSLGPLPVKQVFGPYPDGAVVLISNQTASLNYSVPDFDPANVAITGGTIGGDVLGLRTARAATYIPLGDSRVANGFNGDGLPSVIDLARGVHNHLQVLLKGRLIQLRNAGVSANTSTQMLARLQIDVIAYAPAWCLLEGPVNDITLGVTFAQSKTNIKAIYAACAAAGIRLAVSTISPWTSSAPTWTGTQRAAHAAFNRWIKAWAAANNIPCADNYSTNANMVTGLPISNSTYDAFGHYSDFGAFLAARAWLDVMTPVIPLNSFNTAMPFDYDNLTLDGGGAWTVGAALPSTWTTYNNTSVAQTSSVVARTDIVQGTLQQAVATAAVQGQYLGFKRAASDTFSVAWIASTTAFTLGYRMVANDGNQYLVTTAGTTGAAQPVWNSAVGETTTDNTVVWTRYENFNVGDLCYGEVEVFVSAISGGGIQPAFIMQSQGVGANVVVLQATDQATKVGAYPIGSYLLRTRNFTIQTGCTSYIAFVYAHLDNGATATFQMGRVSFKHAVTV